MLNSPLFARPAGFFAAEEAAPGKTAPKKRFHAAGLGYLNFTMTPAGGELPNRHSWFWNDVFLGYRIWKDVYVTGVARARKNSFSEELGYQEIFINIFPALVWQPHGNITPAGSWKLTGARAGTLSDTRHGQGLYMNEYTGLGSRLEGNSPWGSWKITALGAGYYGGDDLVNLEYRFLPVAQVYWLNEFNSFMGHRTILGLGGETGARRAGGLRLYWEAGWQWLWYRDRLASTLDLESAGSEYEPSAYLRSLQATDFARDGALTKEQLGGLFGISQRGNSRLWQRWLQWEMVLEGRLYGRDQTEFYALNRSLNYDYFVDIAADGETNLKPVNFYLLGGTSAGVYMRLSALWRLWKGFYGRLRNEFLWVTRLPAGGETSRYSGQNLTALDLFYHPAKSLEAGVRAHNIALGYIENLAGPGRTPFFLEGYPHLLVDMYVRYRF